MGRIEKKKFWTAVFIVPPIILIIGLGPPLILVLLVMCAITIGLGEYYRLTLPDSKAIEKWIGIGIGIILSLFMVYGDSEVKRILVVLVLLIISLLFMITSKDLSTTTTKIGIMFFGIFYIGFLLSHILMINLIEDGKKWVLFLIITVWSGDVLALLFGSFWGRHKLYPKISPNKTFEGLLGALIGPVISGTIYSWLLLPSLDRMKCIFLAIGIGLFGQLGDFTESMIKRSANVKDSGSLIPGHGGMLDRVDSFLFSSPFLYFFILYIIKMKEN
jgi:phosphatidate cytidylyltransferase